ncbi:multidrug resistance-associated protein 1, partial [Achlya hypogyna]
LKARPSVAIDDDLATDDAAAGPHHDLLLTPSLSSPYPTEFDGLVFTPFDATADMVYDEVADGRLVQDEERSHGRVSSAVFRNYLRQIGGWPMAVYLVVVLSLWQGLSIGSDLWLSRWSAAAEAESHDAFVAQARWYLSVYAALAFAGVVMTVFRTLSIYIAGLKASRRLFEDMTKALLRAPMSFFDTNPLGRILNRYSGDMSTVDQQIPSSLSAMLANIFIVGFSLATTVLVVRWLALLLLPLLFWYLRVGQFYIQPAREMERVGKTARSPMLNLISEAIEGALVIRAFGPKQVRRFQRLHHHNVDGSSRATWASQVVTQWFSLRIQLISAHMILVVALALVLMRAYLGAGLVGLVLNYALTVLPQLENIVRIWSSLETAMVGPERLAEYANVPSEAPRVVPGAVAHDWPASGRLTFRNMSFRYKATDPLVLKDVSVDIASGEKVGIVGRTGAGKSSLTMALFRINEVAGGAIELDGVDTKSVGVKTLRESIAIIPQNPVLFKGSLRGYLDPFGAFADAQLWAALTKVQMHARVAGVEGQLESAVEENGENFSVGERQMLCMARALLRNARVVVMDEATAAIDHETDQTLQRVIRTEFAASTVLTIAHRLDTVLDCDRILVFDQGRLVQCDSPQTLIAAGDGIFYDLCNEGGYLD